MFGLFQWTKKERKKVWKVHQERVPPAPILACKTSLKCYLEGGEGEEEEGRWGGDLTLAVPLHQNHKVKSISSLT